MLKKSERLDRASFDKVFRDGKRFHSLYSTTIFLPTESFLCSVVVGKKVSKKAPIRNSIRRRIYSQIQNKISGNMIKGSYIFIVKPEVKKLTKRQFSSFWEEEVGRVIK